MRERSTAEINWGAWRKAKGTVNVCMHAATWKNVHCLNVKRWITVEMDGKPAGKQSNYDVLGSKVNTILGTGPLANRYSSILHCIKWPIT